MKNYICHVGCSLCLSEVVLPIVRPSFYMEKLNIFVRRFIHYCVAPARVGDPDPHC
jgi:hypothetical protein